MNKRFNIPLFVSLAALLFSTIAMFNSYHLLKSNVVQQTQQTQSADLVSAQMVENAILAKPTIILQAIQKLQADRDNMDRKSHLAQISSLKQQIFNLPTHVIGNPDGKIVVAEFLDPQCPHCREIAPALQHELEINPELKIVLHDFPVINGASIIASKAAVFADSQGKYLDFHNRLMKTSLPFDQSKIDQAAQSSGLNLDDLHAFISSPQATEAVKKQLDLANQLGIDGTPSFIKTNAGVLKGFGSSQNFNAFITSSSDN